MAYAKISAVGPACPCRAAQTSQLVCLNDLSEKKAFTLSQFSIFSTIPSAGSYNPSVMLEGFVRQAGIGLNTVTNLVLRLEDTSGRTMSADILSEAIAVLVTACPVLRTLSFQGHLSSALMRCLGEACPQLSTLILVGSCSRDLTYLQDTLLKSQPTLLPQLRSLTFLDCKPDFYSQLPDMSNNDSITSCSLPGCTLDSVADWLCLPRHLRHLRVGSIEEGPPGLAGGGSLLSCLVSVQTEGRWRLRPLAKLLRAAPSLTDLKLSPEIASRHFAAPRILIKLKETTSDSSSSDLSLLQHMMHVHSSLGDAHYTLFIAKREVQDQAGTRSYLANLPCMTGIKKVDFRGVEPSELGPLLNLFPNVVKLGLLYMNEIDDVELQSVAACGKLAHLDITACQRVSSVGLLSLCLLRPTLQRVVCHDCAKLSRSAIIVCEQLLRKHGLQTRIGDTVEL